MSSASGTFVIGTDAYDYNVADSLGTYSGVNLWIAEDSADQLTPEEIESVVPGGTFTNAEGDILGYKSNPWSSVNRVIDIVNPFATPQMASNILAGMVYPSGIAMEYEPFESNALIPPHFEIGDAVFIKNEHHGIYAFETRASRLPLSNISASADEELDHEYPFKNDVKSRQLTRKFSSIQSQFSIQAGQIAAKVSRIGENESRTFGWSLTENGFFINNGEVMADGSDMFTFDASGLHIKGDIEADTGHIGGERGFTIASGKMYSGKSSYGGSGAGVYIGTDGISLGSGFSVSTSGNLTATSGTFGSLNINSSGNTSGGYYGNLGGCGGSVGGGLKIGGKGGSRTIESLCLQVDTIEANYIKANQITASYINSLYTSSTTLSVHRASISDAFRFKGRNVSTAEVLKKDGVHTAVALVLSST